MAATAAARAPISQGTRHTIATSARVEQMRRSLFEFVKASAATLEPGTEFDWNWHIEALCFHIQMMLEGWLVAAGHAPANGTQRQRSIRRRVMLSWGLHGLTFAEHSLLVQNMIANLPPGTYKSRILMVCAPAWMWLHCPTWSVGALSGTLDNVKRDSDEHRQLVESAWYRDTFGIEWEIKPTKGAVDHWETWFPKTKKPAGVRKSRTLLGNVTGVHVDALFLDDPDDAHKVFSEAKRRDTQNKWSRAWKNRAKTLPIVLRIAIQQRVHTDDWTAAQIAKGIWSPKDRRAWAWLVMPLRFGRGPKGAPKVSPYGWIDPRWWMERTAANDNLHAARFPEDVIADELRERGEDGVAAQYDQNPENMDAGMVKRGYVKFFRIEGEPLTERARPIGYGLTNKIDPATGEPMAAEAYVLKRDERTGKLDLDFLCVSVDCSNGSETAAASATAIIVFGGKDAMRFVLDDRTRVMGPLEMQDAIVQAVKDWEPTDVLIENKAMGPSQIAELEIALQDGVIGRDGLPILATVTSIEPGGESKEMRAMATLPVWRGGFIYVLDGAEWLYPKVTSAGKTIDLGFVGEITGFPRVTRKDRMDAVSQAITHFRDAMSTARRWEIMTR